MKTTGKTIYGIALILLAFAMQSCVTEYDPKGIDNTDGLLVVEGTVSDNVTVVRLSRSVGLKESMEDVEVIKDAVLYVECSDGTLMQDMSYQGNGTYSIKTASLHSDKQYRLCILLEGEEYYSTFLYPITTPEIDTFEALKESRGNPVRLCLSTHDDSDNPSRYYRWSYVEHWEFTAAHNARAYVAGKDAYGNDIVVPYAEDPNPYYYCWAKDSSTSIIISSTANLTEDKIVQKELKVIDQGDRRLSYLYYVKVTQNKIRKEAYEYFMNLKKNVEDTGGLFSQMPIEMRGNVRCISDPTRFVVGYVDVSTTTYSERYFPVRESDLYEESMEVYNHCWQTDRDSPYPVTLRYCDYCIRTGPYAGWHIAEYNVIGQAINSLVMHGECVDCRAYGTKNKPDFWPNDHY